MIRLASRVAPAAPNESGGSEYLISLEYEAGGKDHPFSYKTTTAKA
jgi:hypothetical protein